MSGPTVREVEQQLRTVMSTFDANLLSVADAGELRGVFTSIKRLAEAGELATAKRVADTSVVRTRKDPTGSRWAGRQLGVSDGQAAALLELAGQLEQLPATREAFEQGRISREQAAEIARTAARVPDAEQVLLEVAPRESLSELKRRGSRLRAGASGAEARFRAMKERRYLRTWTDSEGSGRGSWMVPPDLQVELLAYLRPFHDQIFQQAREEGRRESSEAYAVDALVALGRAAHDGDRSAHEAPGADVEGAAEGVRNGMAAAAASPCLSGEDGSGWPSAPVSLDGATRAALSPSPSPGGGGDPGPVEGDLPVAESTATAADGVRQASVIPPRQPSEGAPAKDARRGQRGTARKKARTPVAESMKILVRVDKSALERGEVDEGELCEVVGVGSVPVDSVRRWMAQGAFVAALLTDGQDVKSVVHMGRSPTALQRTLLQWEQHECQVLGCSARDHLEIDHTDEWSRTGHTTASELDLLCPVHHRMKTHDGYRLEPGRGKRRFLSPAEQKELAGDATRSPSGPAGDQPDEPPPSLFDGGVAWGAPETSSEGRIDDDTGPPRAA